MACSLRHCATMLPLAVPLLLGACSSQSANDSLQAQNQQLQQQLAASQAHVARLQAAIKYTVNSDLLFPSGKLADVGRRQAGHRQDGEEPRPGAAGQAAGERLYRQRCRSVRSLKKQGVTSNQILSQKRADTVMQYMISQGVKREHGRGEGLW